MRLQKCAVIALILCGAALSLFFTRAKSSARAKQPRSFGTPSPESTPTSTSSKSSPSLTGGHRRRARAADDIRSMLGELSHLFQSFTEGELERVIGTLLERKTTRDLLDASLSKRTKRARKRPKFCSLRHVDVPVSALGLGYESNETLRFKYCSGGCKTQRNNYDLTLEHMKRAGFLKSEKGGNVRHKPCCRPTAYDGDTSFLDNNYKYHTIHNVSARACGCV